MSKRVQKMVGIAVAAIVGLTLFVAIGGVVVMLLWNWLAPALFRLPEITFWQALGLLALCRILFGGIGPMGGASSRAKRRMAERHEHMTPQEREHVRQEMQGRMSPPEAESSS
jgi:membrane protein required for beta-lactamase induction